MKGEISQGVNVRSISRVWGARLFVWNALAIIYRWVTRGSARLFLKDGDIISTGPSTSGFHEYWIESLIRSHALSGYRGFSIDVGANIGLTSCAVGKSFSEVICYEPIIERYNAQA